MLNEPVVGEQFFGRTEVLSLLQKRIDALKDGYRQNIALTGQSLTGKSSILCSLLFNLKDEKIIPVYIEVIEEPLADFSHKFIGSLLYNFLKGAGQPVKEDLEFLINEARQYIPNTAAAIERIRDPLRKTSPEEIYSELFNLTSFIKEETHKSCIIIFDEFHNLGSLGLKNPFSIFGKKIMVQKDTMYIVTSSRVSSVKKILSEKLSLLFGNFESIELYGFDTKKAMEFLDRRFKMIRIPDEYKEFLISFTDSNPFYLDVLSLRLRQLTERFAFKRITEETLIQAFQDVFFDFKGTVNQYLSNYIESVLSKKRGYENYMAVLLAMASGSNRLADIAGFARKRRADVAGYLSNLIELDMVIRTGPFYLFSDNVLGFWLKNVHQKKRSSIISYIPERASAFRERMRSILNEFLSESKKDLAERIQNISYLFNNEILHLAGNKKYSLPKLDDIRIERFAHNRPYIRGTAKEKNWIIYIKEGELKDIDVMELVEQCKTSKIPSARKIIVAPFGIDMNANLLAKEEKIWVWDLNTLNFLMSIYGKPKMASFCFKGRNGT